MRFLSMLLLLASATPAERREAPGGPGIGPHWANGNKQGVGTSADGASRVWFTLGDGVLQEVYYPSVDTAEVREVSLLVQDGTGVEEEASATEHHVRLLDPKALVYEQVNTSRKGRYRLHKVTIADPARDAVLIRLRLEALAPGPFRVFVRFEPAIGNRARDESGSADLGSLAASKPNLAAALASDPGFLQTNIGFLGRSDGLGELRRGEALPSYGRARGGSVGGVGELRLDAQGEATLALGFGATEEAARETVRASLAVPFEEARAAYEAGWARYLAPLRRAPEPFADAVSEAAVVLKAHEDKTRRGAYVASLTIPWGDRTDARDGGVGGYHLVWARDLYHVATALLALGDRDGAGRALDYLFAVQERPDGSFPQNSWLDGRPYWPSLQLDEVALPIVLAHLLGRDDPGTYRAKILPAASFLARRGPRTPQERWEEQAGYSPASIAAEIAGLLCAAEIAEKNDDRAAAGRFRSLADSWAEHVEGWCATRTGPLAKGSYLLRISRDGTPDAGTRVALQNRAGTFDERSIVDASFLELVRLGIRDPKDPLIVASLAVVDKVLRVATPRGPAFYRYNHDAYGEKADGTGYDGTGIGRLWPLLTGERGEYALAAGEDPLPFLQALVAFGNEGGMLPEQVWDREASPRRHLRFGEGTGSATPLAWSAAELVRLALEVADGRVAVPAAVRNHFRERKAPALTSSP
jgi:glucoamylase